MLFHKYKAAIYILIEGTIAENSLYSCSKIPSHLQNKVCLWRSKPRLAANSDMGTVSESCSVNFIVYTTWCKNLSPICLVYIKCWPYYDPLIKRLSVVFCVTRNIAKQSLRTFLWAYDLVTTLTKWGQDSPHRPTPKSLQILSQRSLLWLWTEVEVILVALLVCRDIEVYVL